MMYEYVYQNASAIIRNSHYRYHITLIDIVGNQTEKIHVVYNYITLNSQGYLRATVFCANHQTVLLV